MIRSSNEIRLHRTVTVVTGVVEVTVSGVAFDVLGEMVAAHEAPLADGAGELLLARVGALVSGELVAAGESTAAVLVGTGEGPLAGVGTSVCLQVGRLEVVLAAAWVLALVDASSGREVLGVVGRAAAGARGAGASAAVGRGNEEQRCAR